jgi:hypothetical protein
VAFVLQAIDALGDARRLEIQPLAEAERPGVSAA